MAHHRLNTNILNHINLSFPDDLKYDDYHLQNKTNENYTIPDTLLPTSLSTSDLTTTLLFANSPSTSHVQQISNKTYYQHYKNDIATKYSQQLLQSTIQGDIVKIKSLLHYKADINSLYNLSTLFPLDTTFQPNHPYDAHFIEINEDRYDYRCENEHGMQYYTYQHQPQYQHTLLHVAAAFTTSPHIIDFLIKLGLDIEKKDSFGFTALIFAVRKGHYTIVKHLIENVHVQTSLKSSISVDSLSLLDHAVISNNDELIKYIASLGFNLKLITRTLPILAKYGNLNIIKHFVSQYHTRLHPIELHPRTFDTNENLLFYAVESNNFQLVEYLIQSGINPNTIRRIAHENILSRAASFSNWDMVQYLITQYNVDPEKHVSNLIHIACSDSTTTPSLIDWLVLHGYSVHESDGNDERFVPLVISIRYGNIIIMKHLIEMYHVDIHPCKFYGQSLYHFAIEYHSLTNELIEYFSSLDIDINSVDQFTMTPLALAASNNTSFDIIQSLVEHNANLQSSIDGMELFSKATNHLNPNVIDFLIQNSRIRNLTQEQIYYLLHCAIKLSNVNVFKLLIEKYMPNPFYHIHVTLNAIFSTKTSNKHILHYLLQLQNFEMKNQIRKYYPTVLLTAVNCKWIDINDMQKLIQCGADINAVDDRQYNIIHKLISHKFQHHPSFTIHLIDFFSNLGVNVDAQAKNNSTPLHIITTMPAPNNEIISHLIHHHNVNIDAIDCSKRTPLHLSVRMFPTTTTKLFFENGLTPNIEIQDIDGNTPFLYAIKSSGWASAKFLLQKGANPMVCDYYNQTALHLIIKDAIKLLQYTTFPYLEHEDQFQMEFGHIQRNNHNNNNNDDDEDDHDQDNNDFLLDFIFDDDEDEDIADENIAMNDIIVDDDGALDLQINEDARGDNDDDDNDDDDYLDPISIEIEDNFILNQSSTYQIVEDLISTIIDQYL